MLTSDPSIPLVLPDKPDSAWLQILRDTLLTMPTELQQINYLRTFAYDITDLGFEQVNTAQLLPGKSFSLPQYHYLFEHDLAGVYCGGAAQFLSQLYNYFGFESQTYDMGGDERDSHVVTLVKANQKWYVRDAFYHITYLYVPDSLELGFCRLIQLLKEGKHDSIFIFQDPVLPNTDFLYNSDSTVNELANTYNYCSLLEQYAIKDTLIHIHNSAAKVKWVFPRNFYLTLQIEAEKYANFLQQHNKPPFFVS